LQIKEFGFEWIMDWKSIIKCQKEIEMIEIKNRLLKN
jgi:hypothetical protein